MTNRFRKLSTNHEIFEVMHSFFKLTQHPLQLFFKIFAFGMFLLDIFILNIFNSSQSTKKDLEK